MTTLTVIQLVAVNIFAWLLIHLVVPYVVTLLPVSRFHPENRFYRSRTWEQGGSAYERLFAVRRWKDSLPDGAAWFRSGFRKKSLVSANPVYIERFIRETCRGELSHWIVLLAALLFFLWNPWPIGLVMVAYGVVANLPCIVVQRYNRIRFARLRKRTGA